MKITDIKVGTRMHLQLERIADGAPAFELDAIFESDDGDGLFSIIEPVPRNGTSMPRPGDTVRFRFIHNEARHLFQARVVGRYTVRKIPFLQLEQLTELEEVQLRRDYRLEVDGEANAVYTDCADGSPEVKSQPVRLKDLSGGGACFYTDQPPEQMSDLVLEIKTTAGIEKIGAAIRRAVEGEPRTGYRYLVGAEFLYKSSRDKDRIVRHVFRMQQQLIQSRGKKAR